MEIKNILLHLDHSSGCSNRLETAFALARENNAGITGLFVVPDYVVPSYVEAQISVDLITDVTEKAIARAEETLSSYRQLAEEARVDMDAQVVEGQVIPILREHSKYADLLLLGQDQPDDPDNASYGLADALLMLGLRYDSPAGRECAADAMRCIRDAAYRASVELAREKGPFPAFRAEAYLRAPTVTSLDGDIREGIATHGIRNSHLTAIAPTGTISLLANNLSSGIEPVFEYSYQRRVRMADGSWTEYALEDYAYRQWRALGDGAELAPAFVSASELVPADHLAMQAAIQAITDAVQIVVCEAGLG